MPDAPRRSSRSRSRRGDPATNARIDEFLDANGIDQDRDLYAEMLASIVRMARGGTDRGDAKITNGALREMRNSFAKFTPYRDRRKVSIFGSARTLPTDPSYHQAVELGKALTSRDWMVITGGGPGIMTAAIEGAGRENSFVVTIRLPFEKVPSFELVDESHWVHFRYFFTRKLSFMKESSGYVVCPGGFGTLDETFELLTLIQTGKETPAPVVLLDPPEETYWDRWDEFVRHELVAAGLVSPEDLDLVFHTSSADEAADYIASFYRTYHSMRWVSGVLVLRLCREISDGDLVRLNEEFGDIVATGDIHRTEPSAAEVEDGDCLELPRLALDFDDYHFARLHQLVRRLGDFGD
jgi:uncharacterized protein (TIGR00730 family)